MIFFSAPLTTRAPPGRPAERPAEHPAEHRRHYFTIALLYYDTPLGKTEPGKLFRNFKRLKNREDGSDLDDFWTGFDRDDEIYHFRNVRVVEKKSRGRSQKRKREAKKKCSLRPGSLFDQILDKNIFLTAI